MDLHSSEFKQDFMSAETVDLLNDDLKVKTSLRMSYEAQAQVIRHQLGPLDGVRLKLGLSQRKIAQLLMVDPSAWTRWTKNEMDSAPPHIWRALQWYMIIQEKIPGLTPQYFTGKDPQVLHLKALEKIESEKILLQTQLNHLRSQFLWQKRFLVILMLFSTVLAGLLVLSIKK